MRAVVQAGGSAWIAARRGAVLAPSTPWRAFSVTASCHASSPAPNVAPAVPQAAEIADALAPLTDPGVYGWWPSSFAELGIVAVHEATGLAWWQCIAGITLGVRTLLLPLVVFQVSVLGSGGIGGWAHTHAAASARHLLGATPRILLAEGPTPSDHGGGCWVAAKGRGAGCARAERASFSRYGVAYTDEECCAPGNGEARDGTHYHALEGVGRCVFFCKSKHDP